MITAEPSSFRDTTSSLFVGSDDVYRGFAPSGAAVFLAAEQAGTLEALNGRGLLAYRHVDPSEASEVHPADLVIAARRLGFVSVPSEWSFSMLKDAALLTLDLNLLAIDDGFLLKDASAFNVTFSGSQAVFLDHGSLETIGETGSWRAYGQFVDHFLSPLLLEAYLGIPFQGRLRGGVTGIPLTEMNAMLRGTARRKKGITSHYVLRSRLERGSASMDAADRKAVAGVQLPREAVKRSIEKVRNLVAGLSSSVAGTWTDYEAAPPYETDELEAKRTFVERVCRDVSGSTLVDVGANTGYFARTGAPSFDQTIALDIDPGAVDRLYQRLRAEAPEDPVTPIVVDLLNPTPAGGWRNNERTAVFERLDADLTLWLAVLHHLTITGGIPLGHSLDLAAAMAPYAVVEFVAPDDPMVRLIGATSSEEAAPYDQETFDAALAARFDVIERIDPSPTRQLYYVRRTGV